MPFSLVINGLVDLTPLSNHVSYTFLETIRHRWYLPPDLNLGFHQGLALQDSGPNLQPTWMSQEVSKWLVSGL